MKQILYTILIISIFTSISHAKTDTIIPNTNEAIKYMLHLLNNKEHTATEELDLLERLARSYAVFDMKNTYDISVRGLHLAGKEKDIHYQTVFNSVIASTYIYQAKYDTALLYLDKALVAVKKTGDKEKESTIYNGIANIYARQGLFVNAVTYYMKILDLYEYIGPTRSYVLALGNIGEIHRRLNNPERAVYYLEQERLLSDELGIHTGRVQAYCELGRIYMNQGNLDKALEFQFKVLDLMGENVSPVWASEVNEVIAKAYILKNENEKAFSYANECLHHAEILGDPNIYVTAWNLLATIYLNQKNYRKAEQFAMKAWETDSVSIDSGPDITYNIAQANIHLGNLEKASGFLEKNNIFNKKKAEKSMHETLLGMEIRYESERKEMRIASLENEKLLYIWMSIAGAFVLLLTISALLYRHRLSIQKRKNAEQQQELSEQQRIVAEQKHELAEQTIKHLENENQLIATQAILDGETTERTRIARDLHDRLGSLLSVVKLNLENINNEPVPENTTFSHIIELVDQSIIELRRIAHHLMPESLIRYGLKTSIEDFCHAIPHANFLYYGDEKRLEEHLEIILYRCAYELVNNAVKYAKASAINVQLINDENLISLVVHDNGIGFNPDQTTSGTGLYNIRTRVSSCNGKMTLHSSPGKGTEICIEIEH